MTAGGAPRRVQRTRPRVKGAKGMPPGAVYVGRPGKWGNPFVIGIDADDQAHAVALFREWLENNSYDVHPPNTPIRHRDAMDERRDWIITNIGELAGRDLACWCPLDQPCHADVLLDLLAAEAGS